MVPPTAPAAAGRTGRASGMRAWPIDVADGRRTTARTASRRSMRRSAVIGRRSTVDATGGGMTLWQALLAELSAEWPSIDDVARLTLRLAGAALFGAVLGVQREMSGKSAGLRTHMLVALGCACFVVTAAESGMSADALARVVQGLAAGVGFIGAGSILKRDDRWEVHGLTTAASLWLTAALGVAAGLGRVVSAAIALTLGLLVLAGLRRVSAALERRAKSSMPRDG